MTTWKTLGRLSMSDNRSQGHVNDLRVLNVTRGPAVMRINGRLRPAYEWCEMFGHDVPNAQAQCRRCGGLLVNEATS